MNQNFSIRGLFADIAAREFYPAIVQVDKERIISVTRDDSMTDSQLPYILPGFIDSHVHIESSMMIPSEFAKLAVVHGTVATVSDPHEIANVCGLEGVEYMIDNGKSVPFKFCFGAPSCVPATTFETAGAAIDVTDVEKLLSSDDIFYLSEMMNFPGVLANDADVIGKIAAARKYEKPVDGHAPGLKGDEAIRYIAAGISTDHECFTREEAVHKLKNGMKILIREGSAARNFEALAELIDEYPDHIMLCSDDKHPDSLEAGHINQLCARAVEKGIDIFNVLKAACVNPVLHYKMSVGLLRPGDAADFILVRDLRRFEVLQTYIDGKLVAEEGNSRIESSPKQKRINHFNVSEKNNSDFQLLQKTVQTDEGARVPVIVALDGQLITDSVYVQPSDSGMLEPNVAEDLLKIVVVNRYNEAPVAGALIKNFGLKQGAIASSVAHDSHNIVAVGADDDAIAKAVNAVIREKGGVSFILNDHESVLPLPVAGLMSDEDGYLTAKNYAAIDAEVKAAGCALAAPFMTLSFMALLVIPHLKLSDKGLFDVDGFRFV